MIYDFNGKLSFYNRYGQSISGKNKILNEMQENCTNLFLFLSYVSRNVQGISEWNRKNLEFGEMEICAQQDCKKMKLTASQCLRCLKKCTQSGLSKLIYSNAKGWSKEVSGQDRISFGRSIYFFDLTKIPMSDRFEEY